MINSKFTIHIHYQKAKRMKEHWDLRVLHPSKSKAYSFALPKAKLPKDGEKLLAIRTPDHHASIMKLDGNLKNGDRMEILDSGKCQIVKDTDDRKGFILNGKNIKGFYLLIKTKNQGKVDSWLIMKSTKKF